MNYSLELKLCLMKAFRIYYDIFVKIFGKKVVLLGKDIPLNELNDIKNRMSFYCPGIDLEMVHQIKAFFTPLPVLLFEGVNDGKEAFNVWALRPNTFNIDFRKNPMDGWEWCRLAEYCSNYRPNIEQSKKNFREYISLIKKDNLDKCYIFGTGPSLEKAIERDWSDGYRVVCNTIVRDSDLWNHLNPHFIVAGDAIYHFGHNSHAEAFRIDLKKRLSDTQTLFLYPVEFHAIVRRELSDFSDRLIPIPIGCHSKIYVNLLEIFELPSLGNVLPLLLLPIACTLSNNVFLYGFDGRAPRDELFWKNSGKHSYPELMRDLQESHPCFFNQFVPRDDPNKYVKAVHGNTLDKCLCEAEAHGFKFILMHKSWTPTLQKRYRG